MDIYFNNLQGGKVVVRIKIKSILTWIYNYIKSAGSLPFSGNSEDGILIHEHEVGTPESLDNKPNNWDIMFYPTGEEKTYEVLFEWFHINDFNQETKLGDWKRKSTIAKDAEKIVILSSAWFFKNKD